MNRTCKAIKNKSQIIESKLKLIKQYDSNWKCWLKISNHAIAIEYSH